MSLPAIEVACTRPECPAEGKARRVMLRSAAAGVLEMPVALLCVCCGDHMETVRMWEPPGSDGEGSMAKISAHGGPTDANAGPGETGYMPSADPDVTPLDSAEPVYIKDEPDPEPDLGSGSGRPSPRDPKPAWVEYTMACGLDAFQAAGMTKQDLIDWEPELPAPGEAVYATAEAATAQATAEEP